MGDKTFGVSKSQIKKTYETYLPQLRHIMDKIHLKLVENIKLSSQPTYKLRIKSFDSYYKKVLRQKPSEVFASDKLVCITDIIGIRIICAFLEDIGEVKEQLLELFDVKEVEVKGSEQSFKEFGYESVHVLVGLDEDCIDSDEATAHPLPDELVCEIQIRTILQDAWAEVEHELIYKTEFTPFDMPLRRKLASMNASLSLADIIFQEIRDYQKKLQTELNTRRESFYAIADERTMTNMALRDEGAQKNSAIKNIERVNPYVSGTIDDLILQAIHAHNSGDLERAIYIYSLIINSNPSPNDIVLSVIHKHRGMAYFTQNDYTHAREDFHTSFVLDPKSFRSVYYEGIVASIQGDHKQAIECFSQSLVINPYQSHTFFRRACSHYELNHYEEALSDVASAERLGLEDKGLETLHKKLLKKFDMV